MKLRENAGFFQNAALAYGVGENDVFQAVDLFDKKNVAQVTVCILSPSIDLFFQLFFSSVVRLCSESHCSKTELQWSKVELSSEITHL